MRKERTSVIQLNPAYQNSENVPSRVSENSNDELDDVLSTDSESSEYIIVDDIVETNGKTEKTAAQRLHERQKKSTTTKKNWIRRWQNDQNENKPNEPIAGENGSLKIHPAFRKEKPMTVDVIPRKHRRSPDSTRFEPYSKIVDENENRTLKPSSAADQEINSSLHSVIEEIQKQAAATTRLNSPNPFPKLANPAKLVISQNPRGNAAPNAVVQRNRNSNNGKSENQNEKINELDDGQRPFKCAQCDVGFRIPGHLSRHQKSRTHIQKGLLRNPMGQVPSSGLRSSPSSSISPTLPESPPRLVPSVVPMEIKMPLPAPLPVHVPVQPPPPPAKMVQPILTVKSPIKPVSKPIVISHPPTEVRKLPVLSTTPLPVQPSLPVQPVETPQGTRRFRCDVCDIGFRFQGHLDRHLRSTTHLSMEEAVKRTGSTKRIDET